MDYIYLQGKYFKGFVDSKRYSSFKAFVEWNREDKVMGDNI